MAVLGIAGAVAGVVGLVARPTTTWGHLLLLGTFAVQVGLAGAFLVALQFLTGAGWSVALRRVPEAMTALLPVGGAVVLAAQLFCPELYPWMSPDHPAHGEFKHFWLSRPFFMARGVVYVALWTWLARMMVATSRRQDHDRSAGPTRKLVVLSAIFALVFGATSTLAAFDWIMSREPEWFSTIFGVYLFAGLFATGLATVSIVSAWLWRAGPFRDAFAERHRHDLGKLLFGMSSFWMYIWYSQFMLIWYVNFSEETSHYVTRQAGFLKPLFWLNVALNWAVPFLALLPRAFKVNVKVLVNVGAVVLIGHGLDLYLAILPPTQGWADIVLPAALSLGAIAGAWAVIRRALGTAGFIPIGDPYLVESLPPHPAGGEHS